VREKRESKKAAKVLVVLRYGFYITKVRPEPDPLNDLDVQKGQHCVLSCFCKLGCMIWSATVSMLLCCLLKQSKVVIDESGSAAMRAVSNVQLVPVLPGSDRGTTALTRPWKVGTLKLM
jgi:hypothetical protein